jgi:hypothetical protein
MYGEGELKSLKIAPEVHRKAKTFVAEHGLNLQELTEKALLGVIEGEKGASSPLDPLSAKQRRLVTALVGLILRDAKYERILQALVDAVEMTTNG